MNAMCTMLVSSRSVARYRRYIFGVIITAAIGNASIAVAQVEVPVASGDSASSVLPPLTPGAALADVNHHRQQMRRSISIMRGNYPYDSVRAVSAAHAQRMLKLLNGRERTGLHLNAYGELYAMAEQDDSAQAQFAARLATPGLTESEKAYTNELAVRVFADYQRPARLPIAEQYLKALRALGPAAAARQLSAELALMNAYYDLSRYEDAARHGLAAIELLPKVPYRYRDPIYHAESNMYGMILDAVSRTPNGRAKITAMNAQLRASLPVSPDSAALDGTFAAKAAQAKHDVANKIVAHAKVGEAAQSIYSNYWVNTSDSTEHTVPVNDGKIRFIGFGSFGCAPCVWMLAGLQRIYEAFPGKVEPMYVTGTQGFWGKQVVSADVEAANYKAWLLSERKVRFPVALYRSPKVATDYGDLLPDDSGSPNYKNYQYLGKPTTYLVDGTGTIRRVFVGYSREMEQHMVATVRHLLAESSPSVSTTESTMTRHVPSKTQP